MKKTVILILTLTLTAILFTGCAGRSTSFSKTDAVRAVYASVGISENDALYTVVDEIAASDTTYYDVELSVDGVIYRYRIDASRGDFIKVTVNDEEIPLTDVPKAEGQNPDGYIGFEAAKAIALTEAGLSENDLTALEYEMDYALGRYLYEIKFRVNKTKYEYKIDAVSGEIFKKDLNDKTVLAPSVDESEFIGTEAAETIALTDAGIARENAILEVTKWEMKKGTAVYDIEFVSGGVEYEYTVNALTGAIIGRERDGKGSASEGKYITEDEAKKIALAHAGLSEAEVVFENVEADVKNGKTVYEIEFKSGSIEYEYKINATSGEIVSVDRDRD